MIKLESHNPACFSRKLYLHTLPRKTNGLFPADHWWKGENNKGGGKYLCSRSTKVVDWSKCEPIRSPQKLEKFIGYFEQAPDSPHAQDNMIPERKRVLSCLVTHACPVHLAILSIVTM